MFILVVLMLKFVFTSINDATVNELVNVYSSDDLLLLDCSQQQMVFTSNSGKTEDIYVFDEQYTFWWCHKCGTHLRNMTFFMKIKNSLIVFECSLCTILDADFNSRINNDALMYYVFLDLVEYNVSFYLLFSKRLIDENSIIILRLSKKNNFDFYYEKQIYIHYSRNEETHKNTIEFKIHDYLVDSKDIRNGYINLITSNVNPLFPRINNDISHSLFNICNKYLINKKNLYLKKCTDRRRLQGRDCQILNLNEKIDLDILNSGIIKMVHIDIKYEKCCNSYRILDIVNLILEKKTIIKTLSTFFKIERWEKMCCLVQIKNEVLIIEIKILNNDNNMYEDTSKVASTLFLLMLLKDKRIVENFNKIFDTLDINKILFNLLLFADFTHIEAHYTSPKYLYRNTKRKNTVFNEIPAYLKKKGIETVTFVLKYTSYGWGLDLL